MRKPKKKKVEQKETVPVLLNPAFIYLFFSKIENASSRYNFYLNHKKRIVSIIDEIFNLIFFL